MSAALGEQRVRSIRLANIEVRSMLPERETFESNQCEFFCECGKCRDLVRLRPQDFDRRVACDAPVLAPNHVLAAAAEARRVARELREESEAVQAQARQALRRVRHGLRQARVLVVDDSAEFRRAAESLVSVAPWLGLAGSAASGEEAIRLLPQVRPDLVLLDIQMHGLNGIETARLIHRVHPEIVIVLVSAYTGALGGVTHLVGPTTIMNKSDLKPGVLDALWLKHRPRD